MEWFELRPLSTDQNDTREWMKRAAIQLCRAKQVASAARGYLNANSVDEMMYSESDLRFALFLYENEL